MEKIKETYLRVFKEVADKNATLDFFKGGLTNDYFTSHEYDSYFAGEQKLQNNYQLFSRIILENDKEAINLFYGYFISPFAKKDLSIFRIGYYFYKNKCLPKVTIEKINLLLLERLENEFEKFQFDIIKEMVQRKGYLNFTVVEEKIKLKNERRRLFEENIPFKEINYNYSRGIVNYIFEGEKCLYNLGDYKGILINHKLTDLEVIPALSSRAGFFKKNGELYYYAGYGREERIGECLYYDVNRNGDAIILKRRKK